MKSFPKGNVSLLLTNNTVLNKKFGSLVPKELNPFDTQTSIQMMP